jgi:hypothetical protein
MMLRSALPEHHLSPESKDVVKLGMGVIATMTALLLGLVTASAKNAFDLQAAAVRHNSADILALDRLLARYGAETKEIRELLRRAVAYRLAVTWPDDGSPAARLDRSESTPMVETIEDRILELSPQTDVQRSFKSRALTISSSLLQARWLAAHGKVETVPLMLLTVVIFWLTVTFGSFGLFAPTNTTVVAVLFLCALSIAAAIFLILELEQPFDGVIKVSGVPLRYALSHLGQ